MSSFFEYVEIIYEVSLQINNLHKYIHVYALAKGLIKEKRLLQSYAKLK